MQLLNGTRYAHTLVATISRYLDGCANRPNFTAITSSIHRYIPVTQIRECWLHRSTISPVQPSE
jgi:hypothetical protein